MAADDHLSDEDIRAAARQWLSLPGWQETLTRGIDSKLPGDLRRDADDIPRRLLELATDEEAGITPLWARRHEAGAALRVAGYPEPSDMSVLDRTADVLMDFIREHVEKRMRAVFRPEETDIAATPPPAAHAQPAPVKTPRISEHVEEWHAALIAGWPHVKGISPHSANQYRVATRLFIEIIGDRPFGDITHEDGETFRDKILQLPDSHGKGRHVHALEAISIADAKGADRMSIKTAKRHNTAMNRY